MTDFLIRLLPYIAPAIHYADSPNRPLWRLDLALFTLIVWWLDVAVAHLFFKPNQYEWTVSHVLERTHKESLDALRLALAINSISPEHISGVMKQ